MLRLQQFVREIDWPYVALFGVLANVPMWIAGALQRVGVAGWFNVDFLVVGILALFLPRAISGGLLLIAILMDFLAEISLTYYITPRDILINAPEIANMRLELIALLSAGALLVLAVASGAFFLPRRKGRFATVILLASFALACCTVNVLEQHLGSAALRQSPRENAPDIARTAAFRYERSARSSTRELIWEEREYPVLFEKFAESGNSSALAESAAATAYRWLSSKSGDAHTLPDFVLVLVESWGNSTDQRIRQSLVQPYEVELRGKFTILQGSVPFNGGTISGEDRELCGHFGGQSLVAPTATDFSDCLPNKLRDQGFHTIAIHGNHGTFYDRNDWYPRVGFQEIWFHLKLESLGLPDCIGTFKGVCDAAIADWIGKRLEQPDADPRFVYWVTLNSHLPLPNPPPLPMLAPCDASPSLARDVALCNWYRLVLNVHQSVASLAARNGGRPAIYVIVGDHSPPFSDPVLRESFNQGAVPYVILLPKPVEQSRVRPSCDSASEDAATASSGAARGQPHRSAPSR